MECTESKSEITDIMETSIATASLLKYEISETGDPIPFQLIKAQEEGKQILDISLSTEPHLNTEISPQNVNIANDSNQSSSAIFTHNEKLLNSRAITINSSDGDGYCLLNSSDSEDEEHDYFGSSNDSSGDESISDEEPCNNDCDILFREFSSKPATLVIRFELNKPRNLLVSRPRTPYEAFRWFLSDSLLDTIVQKTNEFAARVPNVAKNLKSPVTLRSWKDLTRKELLTFLGLLLHTGTMRMNCISDYWRSGYLFNLTAFSNFMSRKRFMRIYQSLSFAQEEEAVNSSDDAFANFRLIVDNFNTTMKQIYYPGKQLILAKSTVSCPSRIAPKMVTSKVNFLLLTDSNGVVMKYQVNTNKDRVKKDQTFLELIEDLDPGHVIYMGKCCSSYKLAAELLHRQTYCTARLSKREKHKPLPVETPSIQVIKHYSRKKKYFMSTECGSEIVYSPCHKGEFQTVINYRQYMYVPSKKLLDTLSSYHPCTRNTLRSHQRLFVRALQISLYNAFQLFNLYGNGNVLSFSEFRMSVLNTLLPKKRLPEDGVRRRHRLTKIARTRIRVKSEPRGERLVEEVCRRRCTGCHLSVSFECTVCAARPALCAPCYSLTHAYYTT